MEDFYLRHFGTVTRFVVWPTADPHTMADLTVEIFLAALHSRHTYRPGRGSEAGWLYGVARNLLLAQRRRTEREARASNGSSPRLLGSDGIAGLTDRIDAEEPAPARCQPRPTCRAGKGVARVRGVISQLTVVEAAPSPGHEGRNGQNPTGALARTAAGGRGGGRDGGGRRTAGIEGAGVGCRQEPRRDRHCADQRVRQAQGAG
ncbi:RNA polymerase subunit sigma [Nonomuraea sp. FMUSA5-5]|uniref:RNA polymerase subunit sigma n=1 Tax=Nonomuraea composti TaxID=2720023 RepID=A0ABX1BG96_9ACTN|nr:RNA polymerase subunit sigma [Nonomuraea sp. FMUSA5-5]